MFIQYLVLALKTLINLYIKYFLNKEILNAVLFHKINIIYNNINNYFYAD